MQDAEQVRVTLSLTEACQKLLTSCEAQGIERIDDSWVNSLGGVGKSSTNVLDEIRNALAAKKSKET